ncbi:MULTISPECIES: carboxymuconolactone decarboxylase family protein [unclassified Staphylococcus]|uniref:carboxymuconolactone decarboxylase family protein n=1 Tax=unclassified Staphylococcus TaxID=91994 RepID=UPI0021D22716|nr:MULTISPECIES: carboxymuconolactone decarboxylase family protein [unclassified Staphylococcus]UXR72591.1 carboxymuconolactone decarboxylase family protein [Staphylococcus sp. IVB6240]UXR74896.1 carboxymuconolactone decarboxylase family protein [Staphylococcus sp. IVB6238]UXR75172.1 carboxymuconolactone decarboxylase family protein [Staphylococcus sp. IVB6233]UXR81353.1 carboxymuconolactone decarboxylase family protein [Staphylococcus sp. IVB6218]
MLQNDSLYKRSDFRRLAEMSKLSSESYRKFTEFDKQALSEGKLSEKLKEAIAVAVAHTTGCPHCIDHHVKAFKKLGGTKEEMAEVIIVATALKAGSAMAHSVNALNAYDEIEDDELYRASYFNRLKEMGQLDGERFNAFAQFDQQAMKAGLFTAKEKELMAIAVAHTTGCPYCIDIHTKAAKKAQATKEEVAEAIIVATALKAGSALSHSVNALNAYDH